MTLPCGCPDHVLIADATRHAAWHTEIAPLTVANVRTLRETYGMVVPAERTFIDDQFDESRGIKRSADA